ncbi:MAG: hypothetical protein E7261_09150 [Lachnospiraceae bacterium]|nr:hypothetical protein [Lachnospiraceae bacterium]
MPGLKICGIVLIIASTTGMGFFMGNNMRLRLEELKELKKILGMLRGEIRYTGTPLYEAFAVIGKRTNGVYADFFLYTAEELEQLNGKSLRTIWTGYKEKNKESHLSEKDWERLMQFGDNLGYLDKEMQLGTIELYLEQIEDELTEGYANYSKNSKLCQALGICGGLFLILILI